MARELEQGNAAQGLIGWAATTEQLWGSSGAIPILDSFPGGVHRGFYVTREV